MSDLASRWRGLCGYLLLVLPMPVWAADISLSITEPAGVARKDWPVSSGIPLPSGALRDVTRISLFDPRGQRLPLQSEALCRWPDGSIRWLLLDSLIDLPASGTRREEFAI